MQAMILDDSGNLNWQEVPDPVPATDEVVIAIHATAVNRADLLQKQGAYPPPAGWPEYLGLEVSGVIQVAPPHSRFHVGDRVCALLGGGGYAELVAVPEMLVRPIPPGVSMLEAATLPEVWATSYLNLHDEAHLQAADTVLIQAGASGLGMAAIQLAKLWGARVITTVSSEAKAQAVRQLGADIVVNRKTTELDTVLQANPPDIALDCVGGPGLGQHFARLAPGGRWILLATLGGEACELPLNITLKKNLRLIGSTLRSRTNAKKGEVLAALEREVWPHFATGEIRPVIYRTLPITQANAAHQILERHENIGKVVLQVQKG